MTCSVYTFLIRCRQRIRNYCVPYTALAQFDVKEESQAKDRNELIDENLKRSVVLENCLSASKKGLSLSFMNHFEIKTFRLNTAVTTGRQLCQKFFCDGRIFEVRCQNDENTMIQ